MTAILRPHGNVQFATFYQRRKNRAIFFILLAGYEVVFLTNSFFHYLTVLGFIFSALAYGLLWAAHRVNGDSHKSRYSEPADLTAENANETNVFSMTRHPWSLWWLVTFLYELQVVVNTVVAVLFWFVEWPLWGINGEWHTLSVAWWIWLWFLHAVP